MRSAAGERVRWLEVRATRFPEAPVLDTSDIVRSHAPAASRVDALRAGVRLEQFTLAWMGAEAAVAFWAASASRSPLLWAFGLDSLIELVSGGVLLWRLSVEASGRAIGKVERAERSAAWIVGGSLALLCAYIVATAARALVAGAHPDPSIPGLVLAAASVIAMPPLAGAKRRVADRIGSAALRGDAVCSLTCGAMAAALLAGLALHLAFGWWWAQPVASLGFLRWLIPEARNALAAARNGRLGCCGDGSCGG
jgi:divalent metal cation (Fe/Co/Zn/Cd) transporter